MIHTVTAKEFNQFYMENFSHATIVDANDVMNAYIKEKGIRFKEWWYDVVDGVIKIEE
jgi:hypothetical protein